MFDWVLHTPLLLFFRTCILREKCPYSELFCSVFRPNAGKYVPEILRIRAFFTQWYSGGTNPAVKLKVSTCLGPSFLFCYFFFSQFKSYESLKKRYLEKQGILQKLLRFIYTAKNINIFIKFAYLI